MKLDRFHGCCIPLRTVIPQTGCHPERSEGPGGLPATALPGVQARTQMPRYARNDECVWGCRVCWLVYAMSENGLTKAGQSNA